MEHLWYIYTLSGLLVGFIVGMTGVGGGSLMTPILLALGITPLKAVGTDLLYACITKVGGVFVHGRKQTIDWKIAGWLSLGSFPATLLTLLALHLSGINEKNSHGLITLVLGFALLLTAAAILLKSHLQRLGALHAQDALHANPRRLFLATVATGALLGVLVSLSSIGAGAIGTVVLFFLFPQLPTVKIVGTDIAHAVPLTLVAGLGHLALGSVNIALLGSLLLGSLPGIYFGSHVSARVPDGILRPALAIMLSIIGVTMIWPNLH